jgi:tetratricopeptide (TPR) repeat protein
MSYILSLLKSRITWFLTAVTTVVGTQFTPLAKDITNPVFKEFSERVCEFRKAELAADESRFTILISPLAADNEKWHTNLVVDALRTDRAFRPVIICQSLSVDDPNYPEAATEAAIKHGAGLIVNNRADLLIFGKVVNANETFEVFVINENGGCERRPKPVALKGGFLSGDFLKEMTQALVAITIEQIAAACFAPRDMDWSLFAKRIDKLGVLIERAGGILSPDLVWDISQHYSTALAVLYGSGQGDVWYERGTNFNSRLLEKSEQEKNDLHRFVARNVHAELLGARATATEKHDDRAAAISAYDKAIEIADRKNPPNTLGEAFNNRGVLYSNSGDSVHAIADFTESIELDKKSAVSYSNRGHEYSSAGNYAGALADFNEAIRIDPKWVHAYNGRGDAYRRMGEYAKAIVDYDEAIRRDPKFALAFYGRAMAKSKMDDHRGSEADIAAAKALDADVPQLFTKRYPQ